MKKIIGFYLSLLFISLIMVSCNATKLVETYKADESKEYSKVYVVGLTGQEIPEERIASEMVRRFEERGVRANATRFKISSRKAQSESDMKAITDSLKSADYEAILTFAMVGVEKEEDIVTPALYDTPSGPIDYPYYNDYYSYYGFRAPLIYSKGYYESNTVFHMEANLFDLSDGSLMWMGQTKTVEPLSMEEFAEGYAKTVVDKLIYENVIKQ